MPDLGGGFNMANSSSNMAHYGFNVDTVSRLEGGSIGMLAYILREKLYYWHDGKTYDHTHEDDLFLSILLPSIYVMFWFLPK